MGVITGLLGVIILGLSVRWLGVEIGAHHKPVCRWLVRVAAGRLPDDERAAAESEWLQVIEDLRSPTAQLLHSLSFAFSAFHIRQEIAPQAQDGRLRRMFLGFEAGIVTGTSGAMFYFLHYHKDEVAEFVRHYVTMSKPAAVAMLFAFGVVSGLLTYVSHRFMLWYFGRLAQRRTSTPVE
jgi:hypothetical protein